MFSTEDDQLNKNLISTVNRLQTVTKMMDSLHSSLIIHQRFLSLTSRISNEKKSQIIRRDAMARGLTGAERVLYVWRRSRFRSLRSLCLFILRLRFFFTLSAHTSGAAPPPSSTAAGASPIGSRHGCIWRPGWKERMASRRLAGGVPAGSVEVGSGGGAGVGVGVGPCWRCGGRRERRELKGSGGGSRRRSSSRRSGAAAAAIGDVREKR